MSFFSARNLAALIGVIYCVVFAHSIQFQVHQYEEKCIQVDFLKDAVVHANYSISPELNDGKVFVRVIYTDFDDMEMEVVKGSTQESSSLAFVAPEDALYGFCFTDRPRKGTYIEEDRYVKFSWDSRHDEIDSHVGKWDAEEKLAPVERLLQRVEYEAQEMLVEVNHRKAVIDEFRESLELLEWRFFWLGVIFFATVALTAYAQVRETVQFLRKKKVI